MTTKTIWTITIIFIVVIIAYWAYKRGFFTTSPSVTSNPPPRPMMGEQPLVMVRTVRSPMGVERVTTPVTAQDFMSGARTSWGFDQCMSACLRRGYSNAQCTGICGSLL